jgi:hypothetical protein
MDKRWQRLLKKIMVCWVVNLTTNLAKCDPQNKTKLNGDAKKRTCNMMFNKF